MAASKHHQPLTSAILPATIEVYHLGNEGKDIPLMPCPSTFQPPGFFDVIFAQPVLLNSWAGNLRPPVSGAQSPLAI